MAETQPARSGPLTVELTGPAGVRSSNWLVVKHPGRRSRIRVTEITEDGELIEHRQAPFESVIVGEEAQRRKMTRRRLRDALVRTITLILVSLTGIAFLVGLVQLRIVASDSMAGTVNRGDVVIIVSPEIRKPAIGEIAVFNYYNIERTELVGLFTHRIVAGNDQSGWQTQGDANAEPDTTPVLRQDISGVVIGWIPLIGYALQPQVLLALLSLTVLVYLFWSDAVRWVRGKTS